MLWVWKPVKMLLNLMVSLIVHLELLLSVNLSPQEAHKIRHCLNLETYDFTSGA